MSKKALSVGSVLFGLVFLLFAEECFAEHIYEKDGLSNSERADLLYGHVTTLWPADEIWPQMRVAMEKIGAGEYTAAEAAVDQLRADFSDNQYLPIALHEIAKLYRLVGERDDSLQHHQYVIDNWPSHAYSMWSLRDVAILNIALGNLDDAQAALDKVVADFPNHVYIALVVRQIASHHRKFQNYEKAKELYQYVIDHWPEQEDYARWSQMDIKEIDLVLSNEAATQSEIAAKVDLAMSSIADDDMETAEAAINELLTNYPQDPHIATPLFDIAEQCRQFNKYGKARQLYQHVIDTWPQHASARWSQSGVAVCHIGLGNMQAAEAATNKLLADFPENKRMANCLYDIANQYNRSGQYEKAKQFYQNVLDNWPESMYARWSKISLARSNISLGQMNTAEAVIDELVAELDGDFPGDSDLSAGIAEGYYDAGDCYRKLGKYGKSIECYQKVVDRCPEYEYAWNALFMVGRNLENLKESRAIPKSEADSVIEAAYKQLVEKYPDCPAAEIASRWLSGQK